MSGFVLDASALLALLLDEPGADNVKSALPDAAMSAVNLAEVISYFAKLGAADADIRALLQPLPISIIPADAAISHDAGMMRRATLSAGLSLGDRYCLACARSAGSTAITADRSWSLIADAVGVDIRLIR
jgi:ribonuclease VapC